MSETYFGRGVCFNSYAFLTYLNNRPWLLLKRSGSHVLDLQRSLKTRNSCPLSHPIFTKQLLNSPNNSLLQLRIFFSYLARYLLLWFPNVLLTLTSARSAASALNQGGSLASFENEAVQQRMEACKLKSPFHSISINFYMDQNRKKRTCEPSLQGQHICANRVRFLPKMPESEFFCFPLNSQSDWHFSTYLSTTDLFCQQLLKLCLGLHRPNNKFIRSNPAKN